MLNMMIHPKRSILYSQKVSHPSRLSLPFLPISWMLRPLPRSLACGSHGGHAGQIDRYVGRTYSQNELTPVKTKGTGRIKMFMRLAVMQYCKFVLLDLGLYLHVTADFCVSYQIMRTIHYHAFIV